jgi:hypothetical protein
LILLMVVAFFCWFSLPPGTAYAAVQRALIYPG